MPPSPVALPRPPPLPCAPPDFRRRLLRTRSACLFPRPCRRAETVIRNETTDEQNLKTQRIGQAKAFGRHKIVSHFSIVDALDAPATAGPGTRYRILLRRRDVRRPRSIPNSPSEGPGRNAICDNNRRERAFSLPLFFCPFLHHQRRLKNEKQHRDPRLCRTALHDRAARRHSGCLCERMLCVSAVHNKTRSDRTAASRRRPSQSCMASPSARGRSGG